MIIQSCLLNECCKKMIIKKKNVAVAFYFSFKKTVPVKLLISQGSQKNFLFFLGPS